MSRRYASHQPSDPVTTDILLGQVFGTRNYQHHAPMPGCVARCCWPGAVPATPPWWALWVVLGTQGLAFAVFLVTVLVIWRGLGGP